MMAGPHSFLIIDDNSHNRFLLVRTLLRKFPDALLHECRSNDGIAARLRSRKFDAIIAHRTFDIEPGTLVKIIRDGDLTVPIVLVSAIDPPKAVLDAGATRFLAYDEWLRIGTLVAEMLGVKTRDRRSDSVRQRN